MQRRKRETLLREQTPDALWEAILAFEGAIFYTAKGLEYSYTIRGTRCLSAGKKSRSRVQASWWRIKKRRSLAA